MFIFASIYEEFISSLDFKMELGLCNTLEEIRQKEDEEYNKHINEKAEEIARKYSYIFNEINSANTSDELKIQLECQMSEINDSDILNIAKDYLDNHDERLVSILLQKLLELDSTNFLSIWYEKRKAGCITKAKLCKLFCIKFTE